MELTCLYTLLQKFPYFKEYESTIFQNRWDITISPEWKTVEKESLPGEKGEPVGWEWKRKANEKQNHKENYLYYILDRSYSKKKYTIRKGVRNSGIDPAKFPLWIPNVFCKRIFFSVFRGKGFFNEWKKKFRIFPPQFNHKILNKFRCFAQIVSFR